MPRLKSNTSNIIRDKIIADIQNYEISVGDVVSEVEVARTLGYSRSPVREAINELIQMGLLERTSTKVIVKAVTYKDFEEFTQSKIAIESASVQIIIKNNLFTKEQKIIFNEYLDKYKEAIIFSDYQTAFEYDSLFHRQIVIAANNERFLEFYDRIELQSKRLRWLTIFTAQNYHKLLNEHISIYDALCEKNCSTCIDAVYLHLNNEHENYKIILKGKQWSNILSSMRVLKSNKDRLII